MVIEMDWQLIYRVFGLITVYLMFIAVVAIVGRYVELGLLFVEIAIVTFVIHLIAWGKYVTKKF
jgi:hypothetical protein